MLKKKPYLILFFTSLVFFVLYIFLENSLTLDLNIHDTYVVISFNHIFLFLTIILGLVSIIYFLLEMLKINLLKLSIWFHVLGTVFAFIIIIILS